MPKIVDREKVKQEIALKSAYIFLDKGYKSLGMRELSSLLGMSKSALYHYYKTKNDLFNASLAALLVEDTLSSNFETITPSTDTDVKCLNFESLFNQIEPRFMKELNLIQEYVQIIGQENVHLDQVMVLANKEYLELIKENVDPQFADELYTLLYGLLVRKLMEGDNFPSQQVKGLAAKVMRTG